MRQEEFELRYQKQWHAFESQIAIVESVKVKKTELVEALNAFAENYRQLCYCLALAKERQYSPHLTSRLEALVFRGHQVFYRKRVGIFNRIYQFILFGFPVAVRKQAKFVWVASLLFYLPGLLTFIFTLIFPELIYSIVNYEVVANIESMYDPVVDKLGRERQSDTDFMMFGHYIRNNISIAFQTFAGGIVATLGTLFYLIYNSIFFGAISAHINNIGYQENFYSFVVGHASYELTGIVLSGAAGLKIGWAVIAPGIYSRRQAIINAGKQAMILVYGAIFLLLIAAFVEAFWSSMTNVPVMIKYMIGTAGWGVLLVYFIFIGRGRQH